MSGAKRDLKPPRNPRESDYRIWSCRYFSVEAERSRAIRVRLIEGELIDPDDARSLAAFLSEAANHAETEVPDE